MHIGYKNAQKIARKENLNLTNITEEGEFLLKTGAKLIKDWKGRWFIYGYAQSGKDLMPYMEYKIS